MKSYFIARRTVYPTKTNVDPLSFFFFLRKTTKTTTLDKTDKDPLGPLSVRLFDRTNHLFICTKLCRLNNYFSSYYVFHICSVKLICKDNSELLILNGALYRIGELAQMVERPLCMREVPGLIPGFSNWCA